MKLKLLSIFVLAILFASCEEKKEKRKTTDVVSNKTSTSASKIPTFNYEGLKPLLHKKDCLLYTSPSPRDA